MKIGSIPLRVSIDDSIIVEVLNPVPVNDDAVNIRTIENPTPRILDLWYQG
jgi:hypothetical protein